MTIVSEKTKGHGRRICRALFEQMPEWAFFAICEKACPLCQGADRFHKFTKVEKKKRLLRKTMQNSEKTLTKARVAYIMYLLHFALAIGEPKVAAALEYAHGSPPWTAVFLCHSAQIRYAPQGAVNWYF